MRDKIIEIAKAEINTTENPKGSNKTKYGEWFGWNGVAWCGIFVSWVFAKAGYPLGNIGFAKGFAGCDTAVAHFKRLNVMTVNPQKGDIVFFNFDSDAGAEHVGIFYELIDKNTFRSIEGNTSSGDKGSQSNGDGVYLRVRKFSQVHSFVNVSYLQKS